MCSTRTIWHWWTSAACNESGSAPAVQSRCRWSHGRQRTFVTPSPRCAPSGTTTAVIKDGDRLGRNRENGIACWTSRAKKINCAVYRDVDLIDSLDVGFTAVDILIRIFTAITPAFSLSSWFVVGTWQRGCTRFFHFFVSPTMAQVFICIINVLLLFV